MESTRLVSTVATIVLAIRIKNDFIPTVAKQRVKYAFLAKI